MKLFNLLPHLNQMLVYLMRKLSLASLINVKQSKKGSQKLIGFHEFLKTDLPQHLPKHLVEEGVCELWVYDLVQTQFEWSSLPLNVVLGKLVIFKLGSKFMSKYFGEIVLLGNLVEVLNLLDFVKFVGFVTLAKTGILKD